MECDSFQVAALCELHTQHAPCYDANLLRLLYEFDRVDTAIMKILNMHVILIFRTISLLSLNEIQIIKHFF